MRTHPRQTHSPPAGHGLSRVAERDRYSIAPPESGDIGALAVLEASRAAEKLLGGADEPVIGGGGVAQESRIEAVRARPYQDRRGVRVIDAEHPRVDSPRPMTCAAA
jgi:hypothetical protein